MLGSITVEGKAIWRQENMAIELPKFEKTYGVMLTACGKLKGRTSKIKALCERKKPRVARYRSATGTAFVRSRLVNKGGLYLHVDCAQGKVFSTKPKVTHKKTEVLEIIEAVRGLEIEAGIIARFEVPFAKLPETGLIRALSTERRISDMSVKLKGASVSLTGTPIKNIGWGIHEKKKKQMVSVRMQAERVVKVDDKYLSESWNWIEEQFLLFVLGRRKDGNI